MPAPVPAPLPSPRPYRGEGPTIEQLSHDLFSGQRMSFEVERRFAEHFADAAVSWSGTVRRVERFVADSVFGAGPGTRVEIEIGDVVTDAYGSRPLHAVVRFDGADSKRLAAFRGREVRFRGRLMRCDALMRRLFLVDGEVG